MCRLLCGKRLCSRGRGIWNVRIPLFFSFIFHNGKCGRNGVDQVHVWQLKEIEYVLMLFVALYSQCFCGHSIASTGTLVADSNCATRCPGDPDEFCGGTYL